MTDLNTDWPSPDELGVVPNLERRVACLERLVTYLLDHQRVSLGVPAANVGPDRIAEFTAKRAQHQRDRSSLARDVAQQEQYKLQAV
jgi:hypothetical protein